jgi:hypothetical protein
LQELQSFPLLCPPRFLFGVSMPVVSQCPFLDVQQSICHRWAFNVHRKASQAPFFPFGEYLRLHVAFSCFVPYALCNTISFRCQVKILYHELMAFDSFSEFRKYAVIRPMLDGPVGQAWQGAMGELQDAAIDLFAQARRCRLPGDAPVDALAYLASERGLERTPSEAEEDWRKRLIEAWEIWDRSGTAVSIQDVCSWMGCPNAVVIRRKGHAPPENAGHNAEVDNFLQTAWAQFDVYIPRLPWPLSRYDEGSFDADAYYGFKAPAGWVETLVRLLRRFRGGHETPGLVYFDTTSAPPGTLIYDVGKYDESTYAETAERCEILVVGEPDWGPLRIPQPAAFDTPEDEDYVVAFSVEATVGHGTEYEVNWSPYVMDPMLVCTAHTASGTNIVVNPVQGTITNTTATLQVSYPFDGSIVVHVARRT